jgi:hypothetical protein
MRISEAFQTAIDHKIKQIKHQLNDGQGGYCAKGLLFHLDINGERIDSFEDALGQKLKRNPKLNMPLRPIAFANDVRSWTWKQFRDFALRFEVEGGTWKMRLRDPKNKAEKEEAYQAWKNDSLGPFSRFEPVGQGPLIIDKKTGVVYDAVEFLMMREAEFDEKTKEW